MQPYFFPDDEFVDLVFGSQFPICIDRAEMERLACEWGVDGKSPADIISQFHEASADEISKFGTYDS